MATNSATDTPQFVRKPRTLKGKLQWLLRVFVGLSVVLVMSVAAIRSYNMWGLPDAPEPFDIAAYEAEKVPEDENAYEFYKKAYELVDKKQPVLTVLKNKRTVEAEWVDLSAENREWVDKNLPALEIWRQGTERNALQGLTGNDFYSKEEVIAWNMKLLWSNMALLQASRLEDAGDFSGAWKWHKARLRFWLQSARPQPFINLWSTSFTVTRFASRVQSWADHKGVTVAQLRMAMDDLAAMEPIHGKRSDILKSQYIFIKKIMEETPWKHLQPSDPNSVQVVFDPLRPLGLWGKNFLAAEPDRSGRIMRLLFANYLIEADKPPAERSKPYSKSPLVFLPEPDATPSISPSDLSWQAANAPVMALYRDPDPKVRVFFPSLDEWPQMVDANRRLIANLGVAFASRIYEIKTGTWPEAPEKLIGTVLEKLPDGYAEAGGESEK